MSKLKFKRLLGAVAIAGSLAFAGGAATEVKAEGGTFVWGMSSEMSILDPHVACGWLTTNAIHSIFEGLVMLDLSDPDAKNASLKPAIAKSWEVNDDGTVYTFAIRENVKFHDGTAVDADVVKWNYDRFMDSGAAHAFDQAQAYLGYYTRWIKSVEVTGPMTV
ncbi:MAG: ABC transporter substrate-binding protein, partial [Rhodospirillales bacterium]|nr:ABC transporter substrate-binding protein [Rhodospirillales bacterium]